MFERMDADGDGQISRAEHMSAAQERFNKMDANGDGYITKEEAAEMRDKMKEKIEDRRNNSVE